MTRVQVLDHGYVELLDSMGDDLAIVNAARTSFDSAATYHAPNCNLTMTGGVDCTCHIKCACDNECPNDCGCYYQSQSMLSLKDRGLINFLARERHTSPFEQVYLKFAVKAPIFVFREWHRHRTFSLNEMSGRYVELPREFYVPHRDDIREQKGKPGAYYYERIDSNEDAACVDNSIRWAAKVAFDEYEEMLENGVAKEVARLVLPVNTYSKMVWSGNLRNLMHFLSLRNHEHAQLEIRRYAEVIEKIAFEVAPVAMKAFNDNGRRL